MSSESAPILHSPPQEIDTFPLQLNTSLTVQVLIEECRRKQKQNQGDALKIQEVIET